MMRIVLISKEGKRKDHFFKAAHAQKLEPIFLDLQDPSLFSKIVPGDHIKIDPIAKYSVYLNELDKYLREYRSTLQRLSLLPDVDFLNHPSAILETLDKRYCKKVLHRSGIPITPVLDFKGKTFVELLEFLKQKRISQIFIKPNRGSGAAGVIALKFNRKTGDLIVQSSLAKWEPNSDKTERRARIVEYGKGAAMADSLDDIKGRRSESPLRCSKAIRLHDVFGTESSRDLQNLYQEKEAGTIIRSGSLESFVLQDDLQDRSQSILPKDNLLYVNTKKIRRMTDRKEIEEMVNFLLSMDAVIERWVPKDSIDDLAYDLRVVYQFGKIEMIQARGSKGTAITNLHLNDQAIEVKLSEVTVDQIDRLCASAMKCFQGLNSAGFDILLEKNSLKPYIIEINGQGDLMYRDIFSENRIYREQVEWLGRRR